MGREDTDNFGDLANGSYENGRTAHGDDENGHKSPSQPGMVYRNSRIIINTVLISLI